MWGLARGFWRACSRQLSRPVKNLCVQSTYKIASYKQLLELKMTLMAAKYSSFDGVTFDFVPIEFNTQSGGIWRSQAKTIGRKGIFEDGVLQAGCR